MILFFRRMEVEGGGIALDVVEEILRSTFRLWYIEVGIIMKFVEYRVFIIFEFRFLVFSLVFGM